ARLFKYGSGTGTNFSKLRGENESLSGGGKSSGLMSWLKIGDRAAGAIKSGGTTRRAAKMVCLDMDHPDIETFINWKVREEIKVHALVEGMKVIRNKKANATDAETIGQTADRLGLKLDYDFNGESYQTVSGQNSNNSVRIPDSFFEALDAGEDWKTHYRTSTKPSKTFKTSRLWDEIGYAAWRCADPGVQFDSTINAWHTCPSGGRINASNPCSEYMFLDNTACNLASINVLKLYDSKTRTFDVLRFEHAIDLWTVVLEISVLMASYPSEEVAQLSFKYRTLGLGYANLGAMLMQAGIAYDSEAARAICGCISAILTGRSYRESALMASQLGAFAGYADDKDAMLRVMRNHARAARGIPRDSGQYEAMKIPPVPINHEVMAAGVNAGVTVANADEILEHAVRAWDDAVSAGEKFGYRNAQTTVIAPTGTIGLLMDCDTTGIEPDFALVKFKKLAGGGYFKIANASVRPALEALGYTTEQIRDIMWYLLGRLTLDVAVPAGNESDGVKLTGTLAEFLMSRGLSKEDLAKVTDSLPGIFEFSLAFATWSLGDETLLRAGVDPANAKADPAFNLLKHLGLSREQIDSLNAVICGTQTVEGAPHLRSEHLSVFDCANKCGKMSTRYIEATGHIRMMAAAQPFISGAISKTINLPNDATVDDIKACYRLSWELGLKANALYRDGCKLSQPLNTNADDGKAQDKVEQQVKKPVDSVPAVVRIAAGTPRLSSAIPTSDEGEAAVRRTIPALLANVPPPVEPVVRIVERPMRRRLADTRASITHKFNIGGHEGYLTVGLYEDGMPGELFITMAKEGSTIGGLMDSLGTAVSVALQYGVPVESLVNKFTHQRFEPAGMTTNRDIPFAKSLVDYIFRWMGMEFIPGYREANAPMRVASAVVSTGVPAEHVGTAGQEAQGSEFEHSDSAYPVKEDKPTWNERLSKAVTERQFDIQEGGDRARMSGASDSDASETAVRTGDRAVSSPVPSSDHSHATGTHASVATRIHRSHAVANGASTASSGKTAARIGSAAVTAALSMSMQNNMGDAPACDGCGAITVRSGTCYKCLNCGNSMGCS
ncbi:MAG: adenosylcobalamin-dependent ribonucleoside-diphosphate reductase, partial [Pyrinomonadaceae bacterium]|nr:adenosylcobalamin-dependent ribonucleoside-diphosphate reductase [Phycisphaerales bacterium]